jgi:hypothetical protein
MSTTVNRDLRRLILQSEADLLAHAQLRLRVHEVDEHLAADLETADLPARATPGPTKTRRLARSSTGQES